MSAYVRKINYYETDMMGITHHSNYIRLMEEARVAFLDSIGFSFRKLEDEGVTSPVVHIECDYKKTTSFDDEVMVSVCVEEYSGVRVTFGYTITKAATGEVAFTGRSSHCFLDKNRDNSIVVVKRRYPEMDKKFRELIEKRSDQ